MGATEKVSRYNLVTGEDTYASQTAQNPATARLLQSWIPQDDGQLHRELLKVKFDTTQLSGPVVGLYEYDYNDLNGGVHIIYFAAARTNFVGATTCNLYSLVSGGHWTLVPSVAPPILPLADVPMCVTINNLFHVTDGVSSWVYDGVLNQWFPEGFGTATELGALNLIGGGAITATIGRYYWISYADENHQHESDAVNSSPLIGFVHPLFSGPLAAQKVQVFPTSGLASVAVGSSTISITNSADSPGPNTSFCALQQLGYPIGVWINGTQLLDGSGNPLFVINQPTLGHLTMNANSQNTINNGRMLLAPIRTTHWHIYASETDGSLVGQFLASVPVTQAPPFTDNSPFITSSSNTFLSVFRPVRNDPPPPSRILAVHKYRQWRIRNNKPTFFSFSANEEVSSGGNGSPQESWPGTAVGYLFSPVICFPTAAVAGETFSDIVDEFPYPDQSNRIRALISHADALYMFSEKQGLPLFGESLDDFALSQVTAFSTGIAGRFAGASTPHGLAFMSYDRMLYLYPTSNYPWAYVPKDVNVTEQLIDIGKPERLDFAQIAQADLDKVWVRNYRYAFRDWLVVSYVVSGVWHTIVYDFNTKGWFHLQTGFSSVEMFEAPSGAKVLVGGGTDGFVYVADDISGTYVSAGPHPQAIWRPALIDFGDPDNKHVFLFVEFEFDSAALEGDTKINYYLDPVDADNPGTPRTLTLQKVQQVGANLYRGWPTGGNVCQRLLLEINTASSTNTGTIRGAKIVSKKATGLFA